MLRFALIAFLLAAPAQAVTITEIAGPGGGIPIPPDPAAFVGSGPCGSGESVVNDGCSVVVKDPESPRPYGRFDPFGGAWIDSQDRSHIVWRLVSDLPFTFVRFALTDAFDQFPDARLGESYFSLAVGDAVWSIPSREPNGALHWLEVLFDAPTSRAELVFRTRLNDGWGVRQAHISPAPLPAAGLMLLGALGLAAAVGRRRRAG